MPQHPPAPPSPRTRAPPPRARPQAAALQYVRKISGFREPSARNAEAFRDAVEEIAHDHRAPARGDRHAGRGRSRPVRRPGDPARDPRRPARPLAAFAAPAPSAPPPARDRGRRARSRVPAPTWWRRPGPRRGRRPARASTARTSRRSLREHGDAAVRLRPRPPRRERPRAPGRARPGRRPVSGAVRAQGVPRPADPRGAPRPGRARERRAASGIDACSPGEVLHALANGWQPDEISHTGTNVSERDLDVLLAHPIRLNLDAREPARAASGGGRRAARVGIRVNPGRRRRATRSSSPTPASGRPSSASPRTGSTTRSTACRRHGLVVDTLHFHAGSGWLGDQLDGFEPALARATRYLDRLARRRVSRSARSTSAAASAASRARASGPWTSTRTPASSARHLGPYGVTAAFEPGDFVMKDAGVLLGEVVTVERRGDVTFVGLDIGWNVNCAYFIYRYAQEILPVRDPLRAADAAWYGGRPHQRGGRRVRRGLPVPRRGGGRGRRDPQRGRLPPGDVDRPTACGRPGPRSTSSGRADA